MNDELVFERDGLKEPTGFGMSRFFSPDNLNRYRTLASRQTGPKQRRQIMAALAGEMAALRAEMKPVPAADKH
jgi:hypothetical protein